MRKRKTSHIVAAIIGVSLTFGALSVAGARDPGGLPSHKVPNGPGSILQPAAISTPPVNPERRTIAELEVLWRDAGVAYGVPWTVLGAINQVESNFGQNMGPSYAGAVGWMQFLPSTWERWGLDADGDGIADPWDPEDAIYGAARYLAATGAQEDIRGAVYSYNHSYAYVDRVMQIASGLGGGGVSPAGPPLASGDPNVPTSSLVTVDTLTERVDREQQALKAALAELEEANAELIEIAARRGRLAERAAKAAAIDGPDFAAIDGQLQRLQAREEQIASETGARRVAVRRSRARLGRRLVELAGPPEVFPTSGLPLALSGERPRIIGTPGVGTHSQSDWQSRNAVDLAAAPGTPVLATETGRVVKVSGSDPAAGTRVTGSGKRVYGYSLTLETAGGDVFYAHMGTVNAAAGQVVRAGQQIGTVATWSGPAHIHFAVERGDPRDVVGGGPPTGQVFIVEDNDIIAFSTGGTP